MSDPLRLWQTLRPLKTRQITARIMARLRPLALPASGAPRLRARAADWTPAISGPAAFAPPGTFRFLEQEGTLDGAEGWHSGPQPRLWFYNLHYFDDLKRADAAAMRAAHAALIDRWTAQNPPLEGPGWEPYPLSLRIVNWIRWAIGGGTLSAMATDSLARQLRVLAARPEYHLLGNHLLANAKALWFGGMFFDGPEAAGWQALGRKLLEQESAEQILPDGGHFERSPMYHGVILEDVLDVLNLAQCYAIAPPAGLSEKIAPMLGWLQAMSHPDGDIAYFNDAARGVAPGIAPLAEYAERLGHARPDAPGAGLRDLTASGYIRLDGADGWAVIFDAAPVGAPYLPGHGHADTLSFEFSPGAARLVVNAGVSTYEPGPQRHAERGTPAHSTITIGGRNSSDVWGAFRCGRTAGILGRGCGAERGGLWAEAAHDGYRALPGRGVLHHRRIVLTPGRLTLGDRLSPRGRLRQPVAIESRLLLAPGVTVRAAGGARFHLQQADGGSFVFDGDPALDWRIERAGYAPRFGLRETVPVLCGRGQLTAEAGFHCCIRTPDATKAAG